MSIDIYTIGLPTPFSVGKVNVYLLRDRELTLIDTGPLTEEAEAALESELKRYGFAIEQIGRILITHGHQDHFGLARRIRERSGARIALPQHDQHLTSQPYSVEFYARALIQAGIPYPKVVAMTEGFSAMRTYADPLETYHPVKGGDEIPLDSDTIQVLHTPGHTPGSVCYYLRDQQVLFAGDTLLKTITPNPVLDADPLDKTQRFRALIRYLETLRALRSLRVRIIYPGHRDVIADYPAHYRAVMDFYRNRQHKIMDLLRSRSKSAYEISLDLFPQTDDLNRFLAVSEVLANLDVLEYRGQIRSTIKEDVQYFTPREPSGRRATLPPLPSK